MTSARFLQATELRIQKRRGEPRCQLSKAGPDLVRFPFPGADASSITVRRARPPRRAGYSLGRVYQGNFKNVKRIAGIEVARREVMRGSTSGENCVQQRHQDLVLAGERQRLAGGLRRP